MNPALLWLASPRSCAGVVGAACLALVACGTSTSTSAPADGGAPEGGATDASISATACQVPGGADPRVTVATPGAGFTCTRYPFPLAGPREIIEAHDGSLYVSEWTGGRISRFTDAGFVTVASGLDHPLGLRELGDGSLLVVEEVGHALTRVDPKTGTSARVATNLGYATDMTLAADGAALVGSFPDFDHPGSVRALTLEPDGGASIADRVTGIYVPEGLYFEPSGALVVAQWTTRGGGGNGPANVLRFPSGSGDASSAEIVAEGFDHVYGVLAAPDGAVLVGEIFNSPGRDRVVKLTKGAAPTTVLDGVAVPGGMIFTRAGDLLLLEGVSLSHDASGYLLRLHPTPL